MTTSPHTIPVNRAPDSSHANTGSDGVAKAQSNSSVQRADMEQCVAAHPEVGVVRTTAAQRRTNAAWLRSQLAELHETIAGSIRTGKVHRWPLDRVAAAQQAILAGDEHWRMRAAVAVLR